MPDPVTNTYNVLPDEFADTCKEMVKIRSKSSWWMLWYNTGLCSQTKKKMVATVNASVVKKKPRQLAVCTPLKTVVVDQPRIVGERINPTGKKKDLNRR